MLEQEGLAGNTFAEIVRNAIQELAKLSNSVPRLKDITLRNGKPVKSSRIDGFAYFFEIDSDSYLPEGSTISHYDSKELRTIIGEVIFRNEETIEIWLEAPLKGPLSIVTFAATVMDFYAILSNRLSEMQEKPSEPAKRLVQARVGRSGLSREWRDSSLECREQVLSRSLTFVWGPPGTGKTYELARVATSLVSSGKRVLVVSGTNVAVDQAVVEFREAYTKEVGHMPVGTAVRYGFPKDKGLANNSELSSFAIALAYDNARRERRENLIHERRVASPSRKREIDAQLAEIRKSIREDEKVLASHSRIVATTLSKSTMDPVIYNGAFDAVLFDEAGMATIPQILFASCIATEMIVCFGDFRQLPPIIDSRISSALTVDVYSWVGITQAVDSGSGHELLVSLHEQHRCHPDIARFVGNQLYLGKLTTAEESLSRTSRIALAEPVPKRALVLLDTSGYPSRVLRYPTSNTSSRYNVFDAFVAVQTAIVAKKNCVEEVAGECTVAIITPYAPQAQLIRSLLRGIGVEGIKCSTVHGFQGSAAQIVVLDLADSYPRKNEIGIPLSDNTGRKCDRLINVALTRAKGKVITIACIEGLMNVTNLGKDSLLHGLLHRLRDSDSHIYGTELAKQVFDVTSAMTGGKEGLSPECFIRDLDNARVNITLTVPAVIEERLLELINIRNALARAIARNINVTLFVTDKMKYWYFILDGANLTEKIVFNPLCIIDNKLVWYGPPPLLGNCRKDTPAPRCPSFRVDSPDAAAFLEKQLINRH